MGQADVWFSPGSPFTWPLRVFRSAATMSCSVSHWSLHESNGQGESFVGLGVAEIDPSDQIVGSFVQTAWSSFPSFAAAFFSHLSAWVMIFFVPCQIPLRWDVNITKWVALSKKAGSSRSEASWMKGSITQPDFKRLFADAGRQLLSLFVAIAAITFNTVQWRLASSFANPRVTVFCERARQCGMAQAMAKPSACIHLWWATVSLNAGLAHFFLFCRVEKGLKKAKGSEKASALPRKEARNAHLQRHVFFFKRPNCERRARFCHATCKQLAYSGCKATQMIWPLDHGACWMRLFVRIVLIGRDRSRHGFDHAR